MKKIINYLGLNTKKFVGLVFGAILLIISLCLPEIGGLSQQAIRTLGILVSFLILLITEALPVVVISLLFVGLLALTKVSPNLGAALSGFSQPVVFFTLASFGLAAAFTTTPLAKRILRGILKLFGKSVNLVLLSLMLCAALVSSIISNVPTCAVFMAIGLDFLNLYDNEEDKKKTGRVFMIAIPIASMIGGMMTPAGSSINLIAIGLLEAYNGSTISFVEWMLAGVPLALVLLPLAWFLIIKIYKPVEVSTEKIKDFSIKMDIPSKITGKEIKTLIIAGTMLILWVLSSWFSFFNVMVIALLGCVVLFLPGIDVLKVDVFLKKIVGMLSFW